MKKSVLLLVIVLASITVGSAFAITIRLAGDVTVDGTLDVAGTITIPNPTIDNLQGQIINLGGMGGTTPINAATLDGLDSTDLGKSNQSCQAGQLVTGFDGIGNEICDEIKLVRDSINGLDYTQDSDGFDGTSIAIGTDGNPIISFHHAFDSNLLVIHCTTPNCSQFDTPTLIDSTGNVGIDSEIAIGSDNNPVIIYEDETNADLKFVHCLNISCSGSVGVGFDTPIILADADGSTTFIDTGSSIAIGTDGFPVIAYTFNTGTNDQIRFLHCTDVTCSTPQAQTIDSNAIGSVSMVIGSDTFPVMSYTDNGDFLAVAHCITITCSSSPDFTVIDSSFEITPTSIALGSDTFPVVHYGGASSIPSRFVHCTNISCSSFETPIILPQTNSAAQSTETIAIGANGFPIIALLNPSGNNEVQLVYCKNLACSNFDIIDTINDEALAFSMVVGNDGLPVISSYSGNFVINDILQVTRAGGILLDGNVIP